MSRKDEEIVSKKGDGEGAVKPIKKKKSISIKSVSLTSSWQIEKAEDLDEYIRDLREQILKELEQDTIINIEF